MPQTSHRCLLPKNAAFAAPAPKYRRLHRVTNRMDRESAPDGQDWIMGPPSTRFCARWNPESSSVHLTAGKRFFLGPWRGSARETKRVDIVLDQRSFQYWSESGQRWITNYGTRMIFVGEADALPYLPLSASVMLVDTSLSQR
jgi:hypothetical protein